MTNILKGQTRILTCDLGVTCELETTKQVKAVDFLCYIQLVFRSSLYKIPVKHSDIPTWYSYKLWITIYHFKYQQNMPNLPNVVKTVIQGSHPLILMFFVTDKNRYHKRAKW